MGFISGYRTKDHNSVSPRIYQEPIVQQEDGRNCDPTAAHIIAASHFCEGSAQTAKTDVRSLFQWLCDMQKTAGENPFLYLSLLNFFQPLYCDVLYFQKGQYVLFRVEHSTTPYSPHVKQPQDFTFTSLI